MRESASLLSFNIQICNHAEGVASIGIKSDKNTFRVGFILDGRNQEENRWRFSRLRGVKRVYEREETQRSDEWIYKKV